jgi:hypothetical protein
MRYYYMQMREALVSVNGRVWISLLLIAVWALISVFQRWDRHDYAVRRVVRGLVPQPKTLLVWLAAVLLAWTLCSCTSLEYLAPLEAVREEHYRTGYPRWCPATPSSPSSGFRKKVVAEAHAKKVYYGADPVDLGLRVSTKPLLYRATPVDLGLRVPANNN